MKSCHFYRIAQCSSKNSMTLSSFSMTLPWLSMTFAIFHDFRGLENGLHKFHDFPWLSTTRGHPEITSKNRLISGHTFTTYLVQAQYSCCEGHQTVGQQVGGWRGACTRRTDAQLAQRHTTVTGPRRRRPECKRAVVRSRFHVVCPPRSSAQTFPTNQTTERLIARGISLLGQNDVGSCATGPTWTATGDRPGCCCHRCRRRRRLQKDRGRIAVPSDRRCHPAAYTRNIHTPLNRPVR